MIRTLVVDDEKLARDRLCGFLRDLPDIDVVGEAADGPEAVRLIEEIHPELLFLDIQMPGMDGFGVLRSVTQRPEVVFATAYDSYALKAFEVHAADYLLKPISRERLSETVRRIRERRARGTTTDLRALLQALGRERPAVVQIPVQKGRQILVLPTDEVFWFEVEYRLVYAHTASERYATNFTLKELEQRLDPDVFFRAHKSRLVNLHHVKAIAPWFGGRFKLIMRNPTASEVELSRTQARALRQRMHW